MQIIKSAILDGGNIAETARENFLTYQGTKNIITRYQQQVTARADVGGHFQREVMKDCVQLYIELLVVMDPTIYLSEIQERLRLDLGLQNHEVPTISTISKFLTSQGLTRKR